MDKTDRVELLAPAGNFEKLEIAIHYGADAVYLAGKDFSLRNFSGNFTRQEMQKAVELTHAKGVRVYVALNVYARNHEQDQVAQYLDFLGRIAPDGLIIADPGIFTAARRIIPAIPLHISTQANTTNYNTVRFWQDQGAARFNAARELSLEEIAEIASRSEIEVEAFVHGAMCISYSGRCLLSNYMTGRESNRGKCAHPCRYSYAVVEAKRPGQYFPVAEDLRGTYIFNSRDLCMIAHIPAMIRAGIGALKIEGRMKGIHYLATTVKTYREAIDAYYHNPEDWRMDPAWMEEFGRISNRGYGTGFYFGSQQGILPNYFNQRSGGTLFVAKVLGLREDLLDGRAVHIEVRNKLFQGDRVQILTPYSRPREAIIRTIIDLEGHKLPHAQPGSIVCVDLGGDCQTNDLIRKIES
jgi:putative protease